MDKLAWRGPPSQAASSYLLDQVFKLLRVPHIRTLIRVTTRSLVLIRAAANVAGIMPHMSTMLLLVQSLQDLQHMPLLISVCFGCFHLAGSLLPACSGRCCFNTIFTGNSGLPAEATLIWFDTAAISCMQKSRSKSATHLKKASVHCCPCLW